MSDNDSLASRVAGEIGADLLILMSNVDGVYTGPPTMEGSRLLDHMTPDDAHACVFGATSKVGTGGMQSKVNSALRALRDGTAVVICNGAAAHSIDKVVSGKKFGTLFTNSKPTDAPVEVIAERSEHILQ